MIIGGSSKQLIYIVTGENSWTHNNSSDTTQQSTVEGAENEDVPMNKRKKIDDFFPD